jgi:hypothetical protein
MQTFWRNILPLTSEQLFAQDQVLPRAKSSTNELRSISDTLTGRFILRLSQDNMFYCEKIVPAEQLFE